MMKMFLKEDHTGAASGIEYGKKGDEVTVIRQDEVMALVDGGKELYHIRNDKLSDERQETEIRIPMKIESPPPIKKKIKRSVPKRQNKLF